MTRRQFTFTATSLMALTVIGCDGRAQTSEAEGGSTAADPQGKKQDDKKPKAAKLAKEPFLIGPPSRYKEVGVYPHHKDKGVWIVSDAKTLVVFSAICTHLGCPTRLDLDQEIFSCPCHKSRYDFEGINQPGSKAKRPMERCSVRLVEGATGKDIQVDPTKRFRKDKDQWSDPASSLPLS